MIANAWREWVYNRKKPRESQTMSAVLNLKPLSMEEYLAMERAAEFKNEYVDGHIRAMTGASREHTLLAFNIAGILAPQLKNRPCEAYLNDMRVKAELARSYRYPDVAVVCEPPRFEDGCFDTLLNPTLLVEILSPSTELIDRGEKFSGYRLIPSLREYLLIAQNAPCIERYARQDNGGWLLTVTEGLDSTVNLEAIDCALPLREAYYRVLPEA